jgi:hypothetical protein
MSIFELTIPDKVRYVSVKANYRRNCNVCAHLIKLKTTRCKFLYWWVSLRIFLYFIPFKLALWRFIFPKVTFPKRGISC